MLDVVSDALFGALKGVEMPGQAAESMKPPSDRACQSDPSMNALVNTFCHDIRTPLTVIAEFSDLLAQDMGGPASAEQAEFLKIIADRTGEIARMVDDLSEAQRVTVAAATLRRAPLCVRDALHALRPGLEQQAVARDLALSFAFEDVPQAVCDRAVLERVVSMLVDDIARSASPEGRVDVRCSYDADRRSIVIGILERRGAELPEHLRLDWYRARQLALETAGTRRLGFRLQVIRELIERNMGRFWAGFDGGRTFIFTLPEYDLDTLIPLQAQMLARFQSAPAMSVLRLTAPTGFAAANEDFAAYLGDHLRDCDLVLPVGDTSWLLCVAAAKEDLPRLTERLASASQSFAADHAIGCGIVEMRIAGSWSLAGQVPWPHQDRSLVEPSATVN